MMMNTLLWTILGIPTALVLVDIVNCFHVRSYRKKLSNVSKYSIIAIVVAGAVLRGYTGRDFVSNACDYVGC